jgi:hypothetical protein
LIHPTNYFIQPNRFLLPSSFPLKSGSDSWSDNKLASLLGNESEHFPWENNIDPTFDGRQEKDIEIDYNNLPSNSTIKDSTGEDPVDRKMKGKKCKAMYQFMRFLHELLLFFIN